MSPSARTHRPTAAQRGEDMPPSPPADTHPARRWMHGRYRRPPHHGGDRAAHRPDAHRRSDLLDAGWHRPRDRLPGLSRLRLGPRGRRQRPLVHAVPLPRHDDARGVGDLRAAAVVARVGPCLRARAAGRAPHGHRRLVRRPARRGPRGHGCHAPYDHAVGAAPLEAGRDDLDRLLPGQPARDMAARLRARVRRHRPAAARADLDRTADPRHDLRGVPWVTSLLQPWLHRPPRPRKASS